MRVLIWHVHGSWTTSFVQGRHQYFVPRLPERGPYGGGRARTWEWPESVFEVSPEQARDLDFDVVILQRPEELAHVAEKWTGRVPGRDIPAIYLEHNTPQGRINEMRHPAADRPDLHVVHVTHFNDLFWDCGSTPTRVIEHGIIDPGERYTGQLERIAVAINEPNRRARVTGTDLLGRFETVAPVDVFGMQIGAIPGYEDLPQARLHEELPKRRLYAHTCRWTSLGLSLLEAMFLGMPIVGLGTTEVADAVPSAAGEVSTDVSRLLAAARRFMHDPDAAREAGRAARQAALERYGVERFLADWDRMLEAVA
jgi:glycosyltransferase involved in cell wall biosynthesis